MPRHQKGQLGRFSSEEWRAQLQVLQEIPSISRIRAGQGLLRDLRRTRDRTRRNNRVRRLVGLNLAAADCLPPAFPLLGELRPMLGLDLERRRVC